MEVFFWICAALIVIGLPVLGMLMTYGALQSVKEYIEKIQSLENKIYNLESDYQRLAIERDNVEIRLEGALQEKEYAEEKLEDYSYKHISIVNSIHRGILNEIYGRDKMSYLSVLVEEHGSAVGDYDKKDENKIIEDFIKKHPAYSI